MDSPQGYHFDEADPLLQAQSADSLQKTFNVVGIVRIQERLLADQLDLLLGRGVVSQIEGTLRVGDTKHPRVHLAIVPEHILVLTQLEGFSCGDAPFLEFPEGQIDEGKSGPRVRESGTLGHGQSSRRPWKSC